MLSRRAALQGAAVVGGAGVVVGAGLWYSTQPALAVDIEDTAWKATNDEITTHDGSIDGVTIDPEITLDWRGFNEQGETNVDILIEIPGEGGIFGDAPITLYDETVTIKGTNGETTFDFEPLDITAEDEVDKAEFEEDADGETNETSVTLELTVDPDEDAVDPATATDSFTVTVRNEPADGGADGSSTTSIESDEEVEE